MWADPDVGGRSTDFLEQRRRLNCHCECAWVWWYMLEIVSGLFSMIFHVSCGEVVDIIVTSGLFLYIKSIFIVGYY